MVAMASSIAAARNAHGVSISPSAVFRFIALADIAYDLSRIQFTCHKNADDSDIGFALAGAIHNVGARMAAHEGWVGSPSGNRRRASALPELSNRGDRERRSAPPSGTYRVPRRPVT
jgi:hypothetical protein